MAESFTNALARGVGIVTSSATASIGVNSTSITGVGTTGVHVGDLIDTQNFLNGTTVTSIGLGTVFVDRNSLKSILIGGTLSNNTSNQVKATVQVASGNTSYNLMSDIPIPSGSSFVISDAGKTTLLAAEELRVLCDTANGLDVSISILSGIA